MTPKKRDRVAIITEDADGALYIEDGKTAFMFIAAHWMLLALTAIGVGLILFSPGWKLRLLGLAVLFIIGVYFVGFPPLGIKAGFR